MEQEENPFKFDQQNNIYRCSAGFYEKLLPQIKTAQLFSHAVLSI